MPQLENKEYEYYQKIDEVARDLAEKIENLREEIIKLKEEITKTKQINIKDRKSEDKKMLRFKIQEKYKMQISI